MSADYNVLRPAAHSPLLAVEEYDSDGMGAASIGMHHLSEGTCFSAFDAIQSISAIKTPDTTKVR